MNRKLIRPNFGEIKERMGRKPKQGQTSARKGSHYPGDGASPNGSGPNHASSRQGNQSAKRKLTPPEQTNAENFYYLKQMQAKTPMVIVLNDGEKIRGLIEWYDKQCIKITCQKEPNLLIPKHSIKYLYKLDEEPKARKLRGGKKEDEHETETSADE
jgi:sRNA-binding regulator protein Hfq